jgi:hypothetical protein
MCFDHWHIMLPWSLNTWFMSSSWKSMKVEQISRGHDSADIDDPPLDPARRWLSPCVELDFHYLQSPNLDPYKDDFGQYN